LDAELQNLDELSARPREFPSTIASIDGKLKELEAQDLDTVQALEARSAQVGKYANMRLLAASQADKTRAKVAAQQEVVIKAGTAQLIEVLQFGIQSVQRAIQIDWLLLCRSFRHRYAGLLRSGRFIGSFNVRPKSVAGRNENFHKG
jgi:hypothetical protein